MKPLKRLDISKLTAKKLNLDLDLVDDVSRAFYSFLNKEMASINHSQVHVSGLGTFKVRKNKVVDLIKKQKLIIAKLDHRTKLSLSRYSKLQEAKDRLADLQNILEILEEEEQHKKQIKNGKSTDQSLEE